MKRAKKELLDTILDMPDGDRLCHGDFHPLNILGNTFDPLIIDWLDAGRGDPAADVCRSYLLLELHAVEIAMPPQRILPPRKYGSRSSAALDALRCCCEARRGRPQ